MRARYGQQIDIAGDRIRVAAGFTLVEVLVGLMLIGVVTGAMAILVGAAVQSKVITTSRSVNTETTRRTLDWMSERLRNAALNLNPSLQSANRCKDRIVAQDPALFPTTNSLYVSGEIINTDTVAGNEAMTLGYYLGSDPGTGNQIVMEYRQSCSSGATDVTDNSQPLSSPKVPVTALTFQFFGANGDEILDLSTPSSIQQIRMIRISMTVQGSEGTSGSQTETLTRDVTLRNPEPNANNWIDVNEAY
jgi:prepilin-type N-terminal cleavage/methylation domain-containing protein